jgi:hypothetical protein
VQRHALGCTDQLAVHHPGGEWIDHAGHEIDSDFIEEVQTCLNMSIKYVDSGCAHAPDDDRRVDPETAPEFDRRRRKISCRIHVAGHEAFVPAHDSNECVSGYFAVPLQQSLGASQPSSDRRHQTCIHHQEHGDHRRSSRRTSNIVLGE